MGPRERRERERTETRSRILEAARRLFVAEGYESVSMRQIADAVEYSPTAIYLHFRDKLTLFKELCHADFEALAAHFAVLAKVPDPIERLRRLGRAYIEFGTQNPFHYRLMFMTPHPEGADSAEEQIAHGKGNPERDAYEFLRWCVQQAMRAGSFRKQFKNVDLVAQTLWAGVHGLVALQVTMGCNDWVAWQPTKKRAEALMEAFVSGLFDPKKVKD